MTFNTEKWTCSQAEELFDKLVSTLSYDQNQTILDFHDPHLNDHPEDESGDAETVGPQRHEEGAYEVGIDIPAGIYAVYSYSACLDDDNRGDGASWKITPPPSDFMANDAFSTASCAAAKEGQRLEPTNCHAELETRLYG